ncbi:hypothetical protein BD410DRAFT_795229 [Rickenella mellea]|uniref:Uncharacterized protein n=1 Tax=Rickenella mellea TaxID=50990 RepID=A0A4Y7PN83_9AGAM|nr:hypothetical protein BD410DRAFT_795229 [Rickenella mellea]
MPPSTLPPPPTPLPTASDAATSTFSLIPPAETEAPKAATNVTVMAQDPRIEYSPQWVTTTTCTNDTKSANEAGANMLFSFTGSAIFLNLNMGLTGLVFQAALDGQIDTVDAFHTNGDQCGTGWARYGLDDSRSHTVNVTILGKSPNAPPDGSGSSQAAFDFMNFTVLAAPNNTASSATTNAIPSGKYTWTVGAVSAFAVLVGSTLF